MSESKEKEERAAAERGLYKEACSQAYQLYSLGAVIGLLANHGYELDDVTGEAERLVIAASVFALSQMSKADQVIAELMKAYDEDKSLHVPVPIVDGDDG